MTTMMPSCVKAGRFIRLLGWLQIGLGVLLVVFLVTQPFLNNGFTAVEPIWIVLIDSPYACFILAFFINLGVACLRVGNGLKQHKEWARIAGIVIGILALLEFPIGTIIGAFLLRWLVRQWDSSEHAPVESKAPRETPRIASASLVCGMLGISCLGPVSAIPAIICGHIAKSRIRNSRNSLHGDEIALEGQRFGYIGLCLTIMLIVAITISAIVKARYTSQLVTSIGRNICIGRMSMLKVATDRWAAERNVVAGTPINIENMKAYLPEAVRKGLPSGQGLASGPTYVVPDGGKGFWKMAIPVCPANGVISFNVVGDAPECSVHGRLSMSNTTHSAESGKRE